MFCKRSANLMAVALFSLVAGGCSSSSATATMASVPRYVVPIPQPDSQLLFDPGAEYPLAAQLNYRSDWPSTDAVVQGPERIAYRESIYDIQGLQGSGRDLTFRRFRVERVGRAYR